MENTSFLCIATTNQKSYSILFLPVGGEILETPHQSLVIVPAWGLSKERTRSHVIGLVSLITLIPVKTALQLVVKERGGLISYLY